MTVIKLQTVIDAPVERRFDLARNIDLHQLTTGKPRNRLLQVKQLIIDFPIMRFLLFFLFTMAILCPALGQTTQVTLFNSPAFSQAVAKNVRFPAVAQRLGKSVRVYVGFTLTDKGSYQDVAVVNLGPVDESLKQEVDRLWHILPRQDPNYAGDYVIPITFMLGEGGPDRLKPISNQEDAPTKQGNYTLLKEVSVTGYIECELRPISN